MSDPVLITLVIVVGLLILVGILTSGIVALVKHMPDSTFRKDDK